MSLKKNIFRAGFAILLAIGFSGCGDYNDEMIEKKILEEAKCKICKVESFKIYSEKKEKRDNGGSVIWFGVTATITVDGRSNMCEGKFSNFRDTDCKPYKTIAKVGEEFTTNVQFGIFLD